MKRLHFAICGVIVSLVLLVTIFSNNSQISTNVVPIESTDVVITMSASRPGCEKTNSCFSPSIIITNIGQSITWINKDSGFHTVTSGYYDNPDGMFDSGHLNPEQKFSFEFEKSGDFHYYCNLHPWMEGKVIVN